MRKKLMLILACCSFPLLSLAGNPVTKSFSDDQTIKLSLSDTNINRLVVKNDQITHLICPSGFCATQHNKNDQSGSAFLKLNSPIPFTIFLQTNAGHHFSLQVTPVQSAGKTIVFNPLNASVTAAHWEKDSSYKKMLVRLVKAMMNQKIPDGYGYQTVKNADWKRVFNNFGKMQIKAFWQGAHVVGVQYLFYNNSKRTLVLPESAFYQKGVRLVATTEQSLPSHSYEYVYEVVGSGDHGQS